MNENNRGFTISPKTAPILRQMLADYQANGFGPGMTPGKGLNNRNPMFAFLRKMSSSRLQMPGMDGVWGYECWIQYRDETDHSFHTIEGENGLQLNWPAYLIPIDQDDIGTIEQNQIVLGYRVGSIEIEIDPNSYGDTDLVPCFVPVVHFTKMRVVECIEFDMSGNDQTGYTMNKIPKIRYREIGVAWQGPFLNCIPATSCICLDDEGGGGGGGGPFTLTVVGGTGDGTYSQNTNVPITATQPAGTGPWLFEGWIENPTGIIDDVNAQNTSVTMPNQNAVVESTWTNQPANHTLTVNNGSGSGNYAPSTVVNISANPPGPGMVYANPIWTSTVPGIVTNPNSANTTVDMPNQNATVTANYQSAPPPPTFTLTVVNGSGSGNYAQGASVSISANPPGPGQTFANWTSVPPGIVGNPTFANALVTMPNQNATVTANYNGGGGGGGGGGTPPVIMPFVVTKQAGQINFSGQVSDDVSNAGMQVFITMAYSGPAGTANNSNFVTTNGTGAFSGFINSVVILPNPNPQPLPPGTYTFTARAGPDSQGQFSNTVMQMIMYP